MTNAKPGPGPGEFCWVELMTTSADAAERFYHTLFGWTASPRRMADGSPYALMELEGGGGAGGLFQMSAALQAQRMPPHWASHVGVADVEATVARVRGLGGQVVNEPFALGRDGRMAILQDPTGALVNVWEASAEGAAAGEPASAIGTAAARRAPGRFVWQELATRDRAAAARFYTELFGWTAHCDDEGPLRYTVFSRPGAVDEGQGRGDTRARAVAGMLQMPPAWQGIPSHWLPYFLVQDCGAAALRCTGAGGDVMLPPTTGPGREAIAVLRDPQRAAFGVMARRATDA